MNIAELFVRVRGDVSDVAPKLQLVEGGLRRVGQASGEAHFATGRLERGFAGLAERIAGVNPVVGTLATVLSNFAVGGAVTLGVMAGTAAIAVAYDKLTESSRKAIEAGTKLAETYEHEGKILRLGIGGKFKSDIEDITKAMQEQVKWASVLGKASGFLGGSATGLGALAASLGGSHAKAGAALGGGLLQANIDELGALSTAAIDAADKETARLKKQADELAAARRLEEEQLDKLTKHILERANVIGNAASQRAFVSGAGSGAIAAINTRNDINNLIPGSELNASIEQTIRGDHIKVMSPEEIKALNESITHADANRQLMIGAIMQSASLVVGALNLGGGGRGSGIGGAIGSLLGAGLTVGAGVVTSGLWGIVGGIAGSIFGGLFDSHKKAVNNNTAAVQQLTAAMLLNAPSGFKVSRYRFDASDIKDFRKSTQKYATRGGAPVMVVP